MAYILVIAIDAPDITWRSASYQTFFVQAETKSSQVMETMNKDLTEFEEKNKDDEEPQPLGPS